MTRRTLAGNAVSDTASTFPHDRGADPMSNFDRIAQAQAVIAQAEADERARQDAVIAQIRQRLTAR